MTSSGGFVKWTIFPLHVIFVDSERKKKCSNYIFRNRKFRFGFWSKSDLYRIWRVCNHHVRAREGTRIREYDSIDVCFVHFVIRYLFNNCSFLKQIVNYVGTFSYIFFLSFIRRMEKFLGCVIDFERGETIATMMISIAGTIHDGNRARVERDTNAVREIDSYTWTEGKDSVLFYDRSYSRIRVKWNCTRDNWRVIRKKKYIEISHW